MEPRQCTTSVLEALMGFDEQQSQHHAPKHSRVLSEGYLQKVASIGIPKMKSPYICHPFRMTIEEPISEFFSSLDVGDNFSRCNNREKDENGSSVSKSHYTLTEGNNDAGTKHGQAHSSANLDLSKSSRPFLEWRDKSYFSSSSSSTSFKGSHLVNDKCRDFHGLLNVKQIAEEKERTMEYSMQPIKQTSEVSNILDGSRIKTRHDFVNLHLKTSRSESMYDDVRRKETENKTTCSPGLSNWKDEYNHSYFFSTDSYKAIESGGKMVEEGRKMNEMLVLPHYATLTSDFNCKPVKYDFQNHACSNEEHFHSGSPLCLSCKDKRLDQLSKNSHRMQFDSASIVIARSRTRSRYEALRNTWFLKPEGHGAWLQCKPVNRSSNKRDTSEPTSKLNSKKLKIFPCPDSASDHVGSDGCVIGDDQKTRVEKKDHCDQHPVNRENQAIERSLKSDNQDANFSEIDGDSSTNSCRATLTSIQQEGFAFEHCPSKELDSIVNLEEAFQPSPVSVLEPLFREETLSSSETSGINGRDLMMQLELLMSDSPGTSAEEHDLFVSSDDSGGEGSRCSYDEIEDIMSTFKYKDSRDFSYLVDVLSEAGLHCRNMEKGCVSWHGQERHAIRPSVFETLEKKFGKQDCWRRSERKLLFDRINAGLVELFQSFVGVPEWAKPVSRRFRPLLDQETIEEELWILLDSQEREVNKDLVDKQFGKEIGWMELGDEMDSICREIERLLINELIAEFNS